MTAAVDSASPNFLAIRSLAAPPARWRASDPLALSKHGPPASHALPAVPEPQHPSRPSIHGNRRVARRDLRAPWPLPRHPGLMAQSAVTCRSATSRSLQFHGAMLARLFSSRARGWLHCAPSIPLENGPLGRRWSWPHSPRPTLPADRGVAHFTPAEMPQMSSSRLALVTPAVCRFDAAVRAAMARPRYGPCLGCGSSNLLQRHSILPV